MMAAPFPYELTREAEIDRRLSSDCEAEDAAEQFAQKAQRVGEVAGMIGAILLPIVCLVGIIAIRLWWPL